MNNIVALQYLDKYDFEEVKNKLKLAFEELKASNLFRPKMKALIKVCLPDEFSPDKAKTTHPSIVRAVISLLSEVGVSCVVAESPYKKFNNANLDSVYLNTGMLEVANLTTCELNHDLKTTYVQTPNGLKSRNLCLLNIINEVDVIINVGKININSKLGYAGACSNMFGLIPGEMKSIVLNRLETLKDYNNYLIDLIETQKEKLVLNVLDGVVALEAGETQRMLSCIAASEDVFSLDAVIMDILGINYENTILKQAEERGLFSFEKPYRLTGEKIERIKVEDFALIEFNNSKPLHNHNEQKRYFNSHQERVKIDYKSCKGCGVCSKICPTNAITMKYDKNGELYAHVDYKKCIFCFKCYAGCPYKIVDLITPKGFKKIDKELNKQN